MVDSKSSTLALFQKFLDFKKENGIVALSPVSVMADLHNEINVSADELYILATKLIDGIYNSDEPFLYGERIAAIQSISEEGISGNCYLDDLEPDQAYEFLLHCSVDDFISLVDIVAKENQGIYTSCWVPETFIPVNASIRDYLNPKPSIDSQISAASGRAGVKEDFVNTKIVHSDVHR